MQTAQIVIDSASNQPIPVGSIVCDAHGNTGIITDDDRDSSTLGVTQKMGLYRRQNLS